AHRGPSAHRWPPAPRAPACAAARGSWPAARPAGTAWPRSRPRPRPGRPRSPPRRCGRSASAPAARHRGRAAACRPPGRPSWAGRGRARAGSPAVAGSPPARSGRRSRPRPRSPPGPAPGTRARRWQDRPRREEPCSRSLPYGDLPITPCEDHTVTRPYADDIHLAKRLADTADAITVPRYSVRDLTVRTKPDRSPVTDADLAVEEAIRGVLATERPQDRIAGEEGGGEIGSGRTWVLDPIDGTKNFLRGVPVWATLIALVDDGVPVVGVISAPMLARRWWAD